MESLPSTPVWAGYGSRQIKAKIRLINFFFYVTVLLVYLKSPGQPSASWRERLSGTQHCECLCMMQDIRHCTRVKYQVFRESPVVLWQNYKTSLNVFEHQTESLRPVFYKVDFLLKNVWHNKWLFSAFLFVSDIVVISISLFSVCMPVFFHVFERRCLIISSVFLTTVMPVFLSVFSYMHADNEPTVWSRAAPTLTQFTSQRGSSCHHLIGPT